MEFNRNAIVGVLSHPYPNKYVVTIARQFGGLVPTIRVYSANYSEPNRVRLLSKRFMQMNLILQPKIIESLIERYK
jgi:hypothetical protein